MLDKLTYAGGLANLDPVAGRFTFVRGDICDAGLLREVVPGHDTVLNFAPEGHVDRSVTGAAEFVSSNAAGVQVLLRPFGLTTPLRAWGMRDLRNVAG